MVSTRSRGAFILFEGVDRCGKSTQARYLLEKLRSEGIPAEIINFPSTLLLGSKYLFEWCPFLDRNTSIGKAINDYLAGKTEVNSHVRHCLFIMLSTLFNRNIGYAPDVFCKSMGNEVYFSNIILVFIMTASSVIIYNPNYRMELLWLPIAMFSLGLLSQWQRSYLLSSIWNKSDKIRRGLTSNGARHLTLVCLVLILLFFSICRLMKLNVGVALDRNDTKMKLCRRKFGEYSKCYNVRNGRYSCGLLPFLFKSIYRSLTQPSQLRSFIEKFWLSY